MCRSNMKSSESGEIVKGECDVSTSVVKEETSGNAKFSAGLRRIPFNEVCFYILRFYVFFHKILSISLDNAYCLIHTSHCWRN